MYSQTNTSCSKTLQKQKGLLLCASTPMETITPESPEHLHIVAQGHRPAPRSLEGRPALGPPKWQLVDGGLLVPKKTFARFFEPKNKTSNVCRRCFMFFGTCQPPNNTRNKVVLVCAWCYLVSQMSFTLTNLCMGLLRVS